MADGMAPGAAGLAAAPPARPPRRRWTRVAFLRALRRVHVWLGLWGALLGMGFGATGILLNHRAVLRLPVAQTARSAMQLPLPDPRPETPDAFAAWARAALGMARPAEQTTVERAHDVAWGEAVVRQPERWQARFEAARRSVQVEWFRGNAAATVRRADADLLASLTRLHKGQGAGVGWVLLADSVAGSIVLLAASGLLLWTRLEARRCVGLLGGLASLGLAALAAWPSF